MMKQWLENQFAQHYDTQGNRHVVREDVLVGDAALHDAHACGSCIPFFSSTCEHETFRIHTAHPVSCLALEEFFNGFRNLPGERCDVMLVDERKVALVDMYCGMSDYLEPHAVDGKKTIGKKAKVRQQIESALTRLCSIPEIASFLAGVPEKVGIFAYRAKDEELFVNVPRQVSRSMNMFLRLNKAQNERRLSLPMPHGVVYVMHAFPALYEW